MSTTADVRTESASVKNVRYQWGAADYAQISQFKERSVNVTDSGGKVLNVHFYELPHLIEALKRIQNDIECGRFEPINGTLCR